MLRRLSDAIAIAAGVAAFTIRSGHPGAMATTGTLVFAGAILALLHYGRGYRRASLFLVAATLAGAMAGNALWPGT